MTDGEKIVESTTTAETESFLQNIKRKSKREEKFDYRIKKEPRKKEIRVTFIGQPNVGKSSLLNALVGTKIEVSNYPGTSVEITEAEKTIRFFVEENQEIEKIKFFLQDTPGIYSLSDQSPEETITKKTILSEKSDITVLIVDSTSLERGLYFALQILEMEQRVIIGLNFVEDARKKGLIINSDKLSKLLGVEVVPFNPISKNIGELITTIVEEASEERKNDTYKVKYDDHIEDLITLILGMKEKEHINRFQAIRILEEDDDTLQLKEEQQKILERRLQAIKNEHPNVKEEISKTRYGTAAYIAEQVTRLTKIDQKQTNDRSWLDKILLNRFWGPIATLLFFIGLFVILIYIGGFIEEGFGLLGDLIIDAIPQGKWTIGNFSFLDLIREGLAGAFSGIAIALPYVLLFYILLGLMEDIGLLSRFVLNIARFLKVFGLPSKAFIAMILNIGCTVPAITATKIIKQRSDRIKTAFTFAFIPCSSRMAIIMGVVGFYGGILVALAVLATMLLALMLWALIVKIFWKAQPEPLLIELPPYRKPILKNIFGKSWLRMSEFVKLVIPLLIAGGMVFSLIEQFGITTLLISPFDPVTRTLFDLPGETIIPIVFGFIQKDLVGSMLLSALGKTNGMLPLTSLQLYTFGLVTCIGLPCIIALGMMFKEFKIKEIAILYLPPVIYGIIIASVIWRIVILF
jgi:ferrous iron transport protein B